MTITPIQPMGPIERRRRDERAAKHRQASLDVFPQAFDLAKRHGLKLSLIGTDRHYRLIDDAHRVHIDIFPGEQNVKPFVDHAGPEFAALTLPSPWNVLHVVQALMVVGGGR